MKTQQWLCVLVCLVGSSACTDNFRLERKEDRLLGEWVIEEVWFRENGDLFREQITRSFQGDRVVFDRDYQGEYYDASTRNYYPAQWRLDLVRENDFDEERNDDVEFYLYVDFYNRYGAVDFSWDGEVNLLTYDKLNLRVNDPKGIYNFKLRREY